MMKYPVQNGQRIRVGVDIVTVDRIVRLVSEHPGILDTVLTLRENAYCGVKRRRYEHMAARFAAKEAVFKVFGTGLSQDMQWTDVEIMNDTSGKPHVHLSGKAEMFARKRGLVDLDVSLSHTRDMAIAHVIAVWQADSEGSYALSSY